MEDATMTYGKTIEVFLVNGTADSLITAELSNWNGKAIKIPRIEVASCNRDDITQAGIYFLFCKEDDGSDAVYIGEAENVKERLMQHLRDYQSEKETYYWNTAVIFIGRDLNKALIRYLENRFVEIARSSKRYIVLTKNTYRNTVMKESQIAVMEEFVDNVKVVINTLGYKVFEPLVQADSPATQIDDVKLFINIGSVNAIGKVTTEGFVVFEGATVSDKTAAKSLSAGVRKLRQKYFDDGKVKNLVTTEDILFSSSSAAAAFLLGRSVSGPATWKTEDGRTLKDIEDSQTD
jgi:predicted GIY-YIG superfamily endonuclease